MQFETIGLQGKYRQLIGDPSVGFTAMVHTLRKANPRTSFIFIFHTTKEGRFKVSNTHAHVVDVIIQVENGRARGNGRLGRCRRGNTAA
jgi:hypothetical protein